MPFIAKNKYLFHFFHFDFIGIYKDDFCDTFYVSSLLNIYSGFLVQKEVAYEGGEGPNHLENLGEITFPRKLRDVSPPLPRGNI